MSWADTVSAIESRFKSFWPYTLIAYGNFAKPSTVKDEPWVRVTTRMGESERATLGATYYRTPGVIFVQIFTRVNEGAVTPHKLADQVSDIWRAQQFSGIRCQTPSVVEVGVNSGWSQLNVVCPFYTDEDIPTKTDKQLTN